MIDIQKYGKIISATDMGCMVNKNNKFIIYLEYIKFGHVFRNYNDCIRINSDFVSDADGKRFENRVELIDPNNDNNRTYVEYNSKELGSLFNYINMYERVRCSKSASSKNLITIGTKNINYTNAVNKDDDGFWTIVEVPLVTGELIDFEVRADKNQFMVTFDSDASLLIFENSDDEEDGPRIIDQYTIDNNIVYNCHFEYDNSDSVYEIKDIFITSYVFRDDKSIRVIKSSNISYPECPLPGFVSLNALTEKLTIDDGTGVEKVLELEYDEFGMACKDNDDTTIYERYYDIESGSPYCILCLHPTWIDDFDHTIHYDENIYSIDKLEFDNDSNIVYLTKVLVSIDDDKLDSLKSEIKNNINHDDTKGGVLIAPNYALIMENIFNYNTKNNMS